MANLSQQKRERMLAFLNKVKEEHKDDDETLIALDEIENELNSKKYGLVWEKHEEEVDRMMQDNIPVFTEVKEREIKATDENAYNFLLEGDNLHSLKLLEKTHAGKIDVIYIDPPYNTGNDFFKYNDKIIDENDLFRHSKWLSFMNARLYIAKRLLKQTGIIFVSIGDDELCNLVTLCKEIFGEENYIATCPRIAKRTSNKGNYFKPTKDYVLVIAKNKQRLDWQFGVVQKINEKDFKFVDSQGRYKKNGASLYQPSLDSRPNQRYFIECPDGSLVIPPGNVFPDKKEDGALVVPIDNNDKCWRWSRDKYIKDKDLLIFTKASPKCPLVDQDNNPSKYNIYDKVYLEDKQDNTLLPEDVIYDYVNSQGTKELNKQGINFAFSKPVGLIKYLISLTRLSNEITILDFFAGSGTTAQAVLELNKEDGGNRKFILCTNNENNICEEVTYERIKRVIHGYADVEGIPANLKYFKTDFISKDADDVSAELLSHIKEMVELENGITLDNKHYLIVLSDEQADELAKNWSNYEDVKAIYVSRNVLFTSEQDALFSNTEIHIIPDYYFEYELKEVGETW